MKPVSLIVVFFIILFFHLFCLFLCCWLHGLVQNILIDYELVIHICSSLKMVVGCRDDFRFWVFLLKLCCLSSRAEVALEALCFFLLPSACILLSEAGPS